jgi:long-chain acyl-CoA synthetase
LAVIVPDRDELKKWIRRKLTAEEGSTGDSVSSHASRPASPNPEFLNGEDSTATSVLARLASLSWEELCQDPAVYALITAEIAKFSSRGGSGELKGFEVPKAIYLEPELFSGENGLLTATFKLKRQEAKAKYLDIFNRMYRELKAKEIN